MGRNVLYPPEGDPLSAARSIHCTAVATLRDLASASSLIRVISRAAEKAAASAVVCMLRLLANQIEPSTAMPENPSKRGRDSPT